MPRVTITPTPIDTTGVAPAAETTGDPTNNHSIPNDGRTFLLVRNANGAATARTLTILISGVIEGQGVTPKTYSIPAGVSRYVGPFSTTNYGTLMSVNVDNAELKISAYRI